MAENRVVIQDSQKPDEVSTTNNNKVVKSATVTEVINVMAATIARMIRSGSRDNVVAAVKRLLFTIAAMNSTDAYAVGIRVGDMVWRFSEYQAPSGLKDLVVASKVVLSDNMSAINFFDKEYFDVGGTILTPSEFAADIRLVCASLRTNPNLTSIVKPEVELLAESNKYAVNGKKVEDRGQSHITFLKMKFDGEKTVQLTEWAIVKAINMFN